VNICLRSADSSTPYGECVETVAKADRRPNAQFGSVSV
jgi:hypothetical protein